MENRLSSKTKQSLNSHEIPCLLWHLKVHYCIHIRPPPVDHMNPVHILPSMPRSTKWFFFLDFQPKYLISHLSHAHYMPCPSHSPSFYYPHNTWCKAQIMQLFIMKFSTVPCCHFLLLWPF